MRFAFKSTWSVFAGLTLLGAAESFAGTYKHITIDGSFDDWAGVPIAYTDAEDATGTFDIKDVYIANDENFLYVRATLYAPANYGNYHHHIVIDSDNNAATGSSWLGIGSELMIEDGTGYQQKNGGFNEGTASGLDWADAPGGILTSFEARISRSVVDADHLPIFTQNAIALSLEALNGNWTSVDTATAIQYEFAPKPPAATGTRTLVDLTATNWKYNDSGTDLGVDWRSTGYDDTQAGWQSGAGLFGFGPTSGTYPVAIKSSLASGRTTYYFRVPFTWDFDSSGIALIVSNYLSDGAVFYLNGAAVKSLRMPAGDAAYSTGATGGPASPGQAEVFSVPAAALVVGENVLMVEAHQDPATPASLVFGLSLTATDNLPPAIQDASLPANRTVVEGDSTTFSVGSVLGTPPLTYQWLRGGNPISGATNETYTIAQVLSTDAGSYSVEITGPRGQKAVSRSAELTTTAVPVSFVDPGLPADVTVMQGQQAIFMITAAGSPIIRYQWYKGGLAIAGATNAQFIITNTSLADAGKYSVTVSNRISTLSSREATLTVNLDQTPPTIASVSGSAKKVIVTFSEPVDETTANQAANYKLSGNLTVQSAQRDATDTRVVVLSTSSQTFGSIYSLTVTGVKDLYGNSASSVAPFRSAILIDGNFEDWNGIAPLVTLPQQTADGLEFKDFYAANDDDFLYLRFSFYAPVGPLPVDNYYHIDIDADNNPGTGHSVGGIGVEMMIENGGAYQQKNGGFNEGAVSGLDFALAPETQATEFECRIARKAIYDSDQQPVFTNDTIALVCELINSSWSLVNLGPQGGVTYTFVNLPPMNLGSLKVRWTAGKIEISWTGPGSLEARDSLSLGSWAPVTDSANPYLVSPSGGQRYFRLRN